MDLFVHHGSELFNYDQQSVSAQILLDGEHANTRVEYDEYVVYNRPPGTPIIGPEPRFKNHSDTHITHRFSQDEASGATMLDLAFRHGYRVDRNGDFKLPDEDDSLDDLQGRARRVICFRRKAPQDGVPDMLSLSAQDLSDLDLHPATLQYATRVATESRFWSRDKSMLSLILSFSETSRTPCDFLSLTYNVHTRCTTILIRQSWEPRRHRLDDLDEYDHRLESCRDHWAHPLIMPVILLQVQFMRSEETVAENTMDVVALEEEVSSNLGPASSEPSSAARRRLAGGRDDQPKQWGPMNMTNLMKKAHEVLRGTIKLLDTIRWMERAVKLLMLSGDELAERLDGTMPAWSTRPPDLNLGGDQFGSFEREPSPMPFLQVPGETRGRQSRRRSGSLSPSMTDELGIHWHEIRQYLEGLLRLSMSLETERRMAEARCRAQIDIIYSRMAQEDNALNARMAVTSSRDSASMKALAVITAVFLPGEFIGTLFGMSMFDWLAEDNDDEEKPKSSAGKKDDPDDILSGDFWVYWIICIPLTLFILISWRAWWVNQDRYFRRHLSQELSEERYWTTDGKPRELEASFMHDFFYLSSRRDEKRVPPPKSDDDHHHQRHMSMNGTKEWSEPLGRTQTRASNVRQRQILNARQHSLQQRSIAISV